MTTTLGAALGARQYGAAATVPEADDRMGRWQHRLADLGYSTTPGGAHAKLNRLREELLRVVSSAIAEGYDRELDRWLSPVDELRAAGIEVTLHPDALIAISQADAADDGPRVQYALIPSVDHAREALRSTRRAMRAGMEFARGLLTAHPEIR